MTQVRQNVTQQKTQQTHLKRQNVPFKKATKFAQIQQNNLK